MAGRKAGPGEHKTRQPQGRVHRRSFPDFTKRAWDRILPAARVKAGLPEHGKARSRKKRKRKDNHHT